MFLWGMARDGADRSEGVEARRRFAAAVRAGRSLAEAAATGGRSLSYFYKHRRLDPGFEAEWKSALAESAARERAMIRPNGRRRLQTRRMRQVVFDEERQEIFLNHFAGCCDAREAAAVAGVDHSTVYKHRRKDPVFAAEFDAALDQSYARLRVEAVRARIEAQQRLRKAAEEGIVTGEAAEEFERVIKLLDRWDRRNGQPGMRSISPERRRTPSFDEGIALLERKLRHLDIPILQLPPAIARRYDGEPEEAGEEGREEGREEGGRQGDGEGGGERPVPGPDGEEESREGGSE